VKTSRADPSDGGAGTVPEQRFLDLLHLPMNPALPRTSIDSSRAALLAGRLLRGVGTRRAHSARAAHQASRVDGLVEPQWRSAVVDAAWLHDIGYSKHVATTGFHPLDGAEWLREHGWSDEICRLVAWHTGASFEAELLGLYQTLAREFYPPPTIAAAALAWADLTSSRTGQPSTVEERLADILRRYPSDSVVHRAISVASPMLRESAREIESRLARLAVAA
jgi:hypothetical protein